MFKLDIFDLPVYRITREEHYKIKESYIDNKIKNILKYDDPKENYERFQEKKQQLYNIFENEYGCWKYNEIISYLVLYISGSQILGDYYKNDVKRQRKSNKKNFKFYTHKFVPERSLPLSEDNSAIYNAILLYVDDCRKELSGCRFIDSRTFEKIGPYVDWKALILGNE